MSDIFLGITDLYGSLTAQAFAKSFPVGTLMVSTKEHWRLVAPDPKDLEKAHPLTDAAFIACEGWVNSETALTGQTYLVLEYFKDNCEFGALVLSVGSNEKYRITSSWCYGAMTKNLPDNDI